MCKMLLAKFVASRLPDAVPDASGALEEGWNASPDPNWGKGGGLAHDWPTKLPIQTSSRNLHTACGRAASWRKPKQKGDERAGQVLARPRSRGLEVCVASPTGVEKQLVVVVERTWRH